MLFDAFSDTYKDLTGVRPRGRSAERFLSATEAEQEQMLSQLYEELEAELAHEREQRAAFAAKLTALGLEPTKYDYLWKADDAAA